MRTRRWRHPSDTPPVVQVLACCALADGGANQRASRTRRACGTPPRQGLPGDPLTSYRAFNLAGTLRQGWTPGAVGTLTCWPEHANRCRIVDRVGRWCQAHSCLRPRRYLYTTQVSIIALKQKRRPFTSAQDVPCREVTEGGVTASALLTQRLPVRATPAIASRQHVRSQPRNGENNRRSRVHGQQRRRAQIGRSSDDPRCRG